MEPVSIEINFTLFVLTFVVVGAYMIFRVWKKHRAEIAYREGLFAQFDHSKLRMSPYRIGLVYHVTKESPDGVHAVQIWDGKDIDMGGEEVVFAQEDLIPFDLNRFSA